MEPSFFPALFAQTDVVLVLEQDRLFNQVTNELKVRQAAGLGLGMRCTVFSR